MIIAFQLIAICAPIAKQYNFNVDKEHLLHEEIRFSHYDTYDIAFWY